MSKESIIYVILIVILSIGGIAFAIWFFSTYGNTPIGELPTWLWWITK